VVAGFESKDGTDPIRGERVEALTGYHDERRSWRTRPLAVGSLACPGCDAPVAPGPGTHGPPEPVACPWCGRAGRLRDFLTLGSPTRPARVVVRVRGR
jgi:hypothetical protein